MINRNVLKCPSCGFGVYTKAKKRDCAMCNTRMDYVCKEEEYKKREENK